MPPADLLDLLVDARVLGAPAADAVRERWKARGGLLVEEVVRTAGVTHERVAEAVSERLGLPRVPDEEVVEVSRSLAACIPETVARTWGIVPLAATDEGLRVAFHDPAARAARWEHEGVTWFVGTAPAVEAAIARLYPTTVPGRRASTPPITAPATTAPPDNEVPNRDFDSALGLAPRAEPVMLFKRKQAPGPVMLTRRKADAARVTSVGMAAERMFVADNLHQVAAVMAAYLARYLPRVVVLDLFQSPARVLAVEGTSVELSMRHVHTLPGLDVMLTETVPYYGPAVVEDTWAQFYAQLGGPPPGSMLVIPVWQGEVARLMVYADSPAMERVADTREFEMLAREMAMAMESRGF